MKGWPSFNKDNIYAGPLPARSLRTSFIGRIKSGKLKSTKATAFPVEVAMRLTGHLFASWVSGLCARVVLHTPLVGSSGNVAAPQLNSQNASSQAPVRWRVLGVLSRRKMATSSSSCLDQPPEKKARCLTVGPLLEDTLAPSHQLQMPSPKQSLSRGLSPRHLLIDGRRPYTASASLVASHSLPSPLDWSALAPASAAHWTQLLRDAAPFTAQGSSSSDRPLGR